MVNNMEVKKIGIVFSGGLARGVAQLAFANEIVKQIGIDRIAFVSGSSIGALNAYSLSCGTQEKLLKFYSGSELNSLLSFKKAIKNGLMMDAFKVGGRAEMRFPTYVSASRLFPLDVYYYNLNCVTKNDLPKILNLSMSFPFLNGPKLFNGRFYLDGGTADNVPIYPAEYFDLDMIIVIHCYPKYYPSSKFLKKDRIFIDVDCTLEMDRGITPFSIDKYSIDKMISIGSRQGKLFAKEIFKDFDYDNLRQRCFDYTIAHIQKRKEKSAGMLALVEYANALFSFKD